MTNRRKHGRRWCRATSVAAVAAALAVAPALGQLTKVVMSGDPAPGMGPGVTIAGFNNAVPTINAAGQVSFSAQLTGSGVTAANDSAIWAGLPAAVAPVAREGDAAPGLGADVVFGDVSGGVQPVDAIGRSVFRATVTGTGVDSTNDDAVWAGLPGAPQLVARKGDALPNVGPGLTLSSITSTPVGIGSGIDFRTTLAGTGVTSANSDLQATAGAGGVQAVIRSGTAVPGGNVGDVVGSLGGSVARNSSGQFAHILTINRTSPVTTTLSAIGVGSAGTLQTVARQGDLAGLGTGVLYGKFGPPFQFGLGIRDNGGFAVASTLTGTGVNSTNDTALWLGSGAAALQSVAREGAVIPNTGGATFGDLVNPVPKADGQGHVAFRNAIKRSGVAGDALLVGTPSLLSIVAETKQPAPGTESGTTFASLSDPLVIGAHAFLFTGNLNDGLGASAGTGFWWADASNGTAALLLRSGQQLDVDPGPAEDLRTISASGFGYAGVSDPDNLLSGGRLAIRLAFTDGSSGVFTMPTPAPEPTTFSVLAAALTVATLRRRRRR